MRSLPRSWRSAALVLLLGAVTGCASVPGGPDDPLEGFNRGVYAFNRDLDRALFKPVAEGYRALTPDPIEDAVRNFFANLRDAITAANSLLQLKLTRALEDAARVTFNTTLGLGGLIDLASDLGLERHDEDFGQTLGYWGIDSGPYLVLPILGPSSIRDGLGKLVDLALLDPLRELDDVAARNALYVGRGIDARAGLLKGERVLEQAALDEYSFVRDAYLQRRRYLIRDGGSE